MIDMRYDLLLSNMTQTVACKNRNGTYELNLNYNLFGSKTILDFVGKLNFLKEHNRRIKKIVFEMNVYLFRDLASVLLFNLVFLDFLKTFQNKKLEFNMHIDSKPYTAQILAKTPFSMFWKKANRKKEPKIVYEAIQEFISKCTSTVPNLYLQEGYLWQIVDKNLKQPVSKLLKDVQFFMSSFSDDKKFNLDVMRIVDEITNNALEHSNENCLVYITNLKDLTDQNQTDDFESVTIGIICLSDKKIYTDIKRKFFKNEIKREIIYEAYQNHQPYFCNNDCCFQGQYNENHFFTLGAIQPYISGRDNQSGGGTGLPIFINKIENKIVDNRCYIFSETNILAFHKEFTRVDSNTQSVGLNKSNSFLDIPDVNAIYNSKFYLNGILYNIELFRKVDSNGEQTKQN